MVWVPSGGGLPVVLQLDRVSAAMMAKLRTKRVDLNVVFMIVIFTFVFLVVVSGT